jgi:hypothetical protein
LSITSWVWLAYAPTVVVPALNRSCFGCTLLFLPYKFFIQIPIIILTLP